LKLKDLGWNEFFKESFNDLWKEGIIPGRIFSEQRGEYKIQTEAGILSCRISGKLRLSFDQGGEVPAVGDFVMVAPRADEGSGTIHNILSRKTKLSRKIAGEVTREQVMVTNIDYVFIVMALNNDFNIKRLDRYLIVAWESGAIPVVLLTKADLCIDLAEKLEEVQNSALGVMVHAVSTVIPIGIDTVKEYIKPGTTTALIGSSGVGKSTLINAILGEEVQKVEGLRDDDRGRHTSTYRSIFSLKDGGLIVDTPGMRELQLWTGEEGIIGTYEDIKAIAKNCRFKDCQHKKEPGCAINEALDEGILVAERLESYKKLQKELLYIEGKQKEIERAMNKKQTRLTSKIKA